MGRHRRGGCLIGFKLTAYDRTTVSQRTNSIWRQRRAEPFRTFLQLRVVLSCYRTTKLSWTFIEDLTAVFANAHRGSRVIDLSGISRDLAGTLKTSSEHGVEVLDVTISGSTPVAENGLLTLFGAEQGMLRRLPS